MRITVWVLMVISQELKMGKYWAVIKFMIKPSYFKSIMFLARNLSKCKYRGVKSALPLGDVHFSHEINYPKWVKRLETSYSKYGLATYPPIKVLKIDGKYFVIDGNHRLQALKNTFSNITPISVIMLEEVVNG